MGVSTVVVSTVHRRRWADPGVVHAWSSGGAKGRRMASRVIGTIGNRRHIRGMSQNTSKYYQHLYTVYTVYTYHHTYIYIYLFMFSQVFFFFCVCVCCCFLPHNFCCPGAERLHRLHHRQPASHLGANGGGAARLNWRWERMTRSGRDMRYVCNCKLLYVVDSKHSSWDGHKNTRPRE